MINTLTDTFECDIVEYSYIRFFDIVGYIDNAEIRGLTLESRFINHPTFTRIVKGYDKHLEILESVMMS